MEIVGQFLQNIPFIIDFMSLIRENAKVSNDEGEKFSD